MHDDITNPPSGEFPFPQEYPNPIPAATPSLRERIGAEARRRDGIRFPEYMSMALYDPELGYYARGGCQVGRGGDFYTSVSVGPLFGRLLARRFLAWWETNGKPAAWRILEIGAHDGTLASDILAEMRLLSPEAWQALEYATAEPLPRLRSLQTERLAPLASRLLVAESLAEVAAHPLPGLAFGNEILDALPFHLVRRDAGAWEELHVIETDGRLLFEPRPIGAGTAQAERLAALGEGYPDGYRTEIRTNFGSFLADVAACLSDGILVFADYGFAEPEYYDVSRSEGTLRTYSRHRAGDDPLAAPGEADITAHVDFTDLARAAAASGYSPAIFTSQGSYLTNLARTMILQGGMDDPKTIAQFRSLTHPAHLGARFHVIEFARNVATPADAAHRLAL